MFTTTTTSVYYDYDICLLDYDQFYNKDIPEHDQHHQNFDGRNDSAICLGDGSSCLSQFRSAYCCSAVRLRLLSLGSAASPAVLAVAPLAIMAAMRIQDGWYVTFHSNTRPELTNNMYQVARRDPASDRVIIENVANRDMQFSVRETALTPTALVPSSVQDLSLQAEVDVLDVFVRSGAFRQRAGYVGGVPEHMLNLWLPLPGMGGNALMVCRADTAVSRVGQLVMFPLLRNYEVWFTSREMGEHWRMEHCDIIKVCPQRQCWPWCAWCRRFEFPVMQHRGSLKHLKMLHKITDVDPETVRYEVLNFR